MASLVTAAGKIITAIRADNDFADRLSFRYTTTMLVVFAVLITSKQYVGQPIQCWCPEHFSKKADHIKYAKDYCWISNTYFLPFQSDIPREGQEYKLDERGGRHIAYYQWTPLILLFQGLLFYLPYLIWQRVGDNSGIDVGNLIESGQLIASVQMEDDIREKIVRKMSKMVHRYLTSDGQLEDAYDAERNRACCGGYFSRLTLSLKYMLCRLVCPGFGRHRANYLTTLYLLVKLLYIANVVGQLYMMNALLGASYHSYGIDVLTAIANGTDWTASPMFPRVTFCDMRIRRLGAVHRYTIQCVLPINLFNEKIYLFLWFWTVFVAVITAVSTLSWFLRVILHNDRHHYVRRYVNLAIKLKKLEEQQVPEFVDKYLRYDGVFLLRMMTLASNALTTVELAGALWHKYYDHVNPPHSHVKLFGGGLEYRPGGGTASSRSTLDVKQRKPTAAPLSPAHTDHDYDPLAENG